MEPGTQASRWTALAVVVAAVFGLFVFYLPARGITFQWDDWVLFAGIARVGRPAAWFVPVGEHWKPIFLAALDLEHALFGAAHDRYLEVLLLLHVGNVFLLARFLASRLGDERAGAIAALFFGVTAHHRMALWWATCLCVLLWLAVTLGGLLALEKFRRTGSRGAAIGIGVAAFVAPLTFGAGLAFGPLLIVDAWFRVPRETRRRAALAAAIGWAGACVLYATFSNGKTQAGVPDSLPHSLQAVTYFVELLGLGFVQQVPLLPVEHTPGVAYVLSLVYVAAVLALAAGLASEDRRRLLLAQVFLASVFVPIALVRWRYAYSPRLQATNSEYQYLATIGWTTTLGTIVVVLRRWRGWTTWVVVALALPLAWGHGRMSANDDALFTPRARLALRHRELVEHLGAAARAARGPIWNAPLPRHLAWSGETWSADVVQATAPGVHATWTAERTPETEAPFREDPLLVPLLPSH